MATIYKVLGQVNASSNTTATLYTVPSTSSAVISTVAVCNQSSTTTFFIAVQPGGATLSSKHYIMYNTTLPANDTMNITIGITLSPTDVISVRSTSTSVSFLIFGSEVY